MGNLGETEYAWNSADGILIINDNDGSAKKIYADFRVSFTHNFRMCTCPDTIDFRVTVLNN